MAGLSAALLALHSDPDTANLADLGDEFRTADRRGRCRGPRRGVQTQIVQLFDYTGD